jgi:cyclic pyranopterin phosphate synthase
VSEFSHVDETGRLRMVDVGGKPVSRRRATARATVRMAPDTAARLRSLPKGDALAAAELAGVMAAKRTSDLIPLCHPLPLTHVQVDFALDAAAGAVHCTVQAETLGRTGVEMEALTAVQVGLLTVYDMVKAIDRGMVMEGIRVLEKHGGKSGSWTNP